MWQLWCRSSNVLCIIKTNYIWCFTNKTLLPLTCFLYLLQWHITRGCLYCKVILYIIQYKLMHRYSGIHILYNYVQWFWWSCSQIYKRVTFTWPMQQTELRVLTSNYNEALYTSHNFNKLCSESPPLLHKPTRYRHA